MATAHDVLSSMYKKGADRLPEGVKRIPLVRYVRNVLFSSLKSGSAVIQGHRMFLDPQDTLALSIKEVYEPFQTDLVQQEIKPGDTVLDLGAHIGYYTLNFANCVGPNGAVFAFEPNADNFALLQKNVEANGYQNVTMIQKAVSDKTGQTRLYLAKENTGDHRIYDSQDGRPSTAIEIVRLDEYFRNHRGDVHFIKMDIQGAEGNALLGMEKLMRKSRRLKLLTEFWPIGLRRCGTNPAGFLKMLESRGFKLYNIEEDKRTIREVLPSELLINFTPENQKYTNLLCLKKS